MKRVIFVAAAVAVIVGLSACADDPDASSERRQELYQRVRDNFYKQDSYRFYGNFMRRTNLTGSSFEQIFTGRVKNRYDLYVRSDMTDGKQGATKEYTVLTLGGDVYEKPDRKSDWKKVKKTDQSVQWRMQQWNPIYYFQMMDNWQTSVVPISIEPPVTLPMREVKADRLATIRVNLDPEKVRPWLVKEIREDGTNVSGNDLKNVRAYFNVYINETDDLPTLLELHVNSEYVNNEALVRERRKRSLYFWSYGKEFDWPQTIRRLTQDEERQDRG